MGKEKNSLMDENAVFESSNNTVTEPENDSVSMPEENKKTESEVKKAEERVKTDPNMLPKDTVHCYPANSKLIMRRRVVCGIVTALSVFGAVYFFLPSSQNLLFAIVFLVALAISVLVFAQTFLIANYRVAVDYNEKKIILRYQFQKILIDFANFETRDGKPDKADELRGLTTKTNVGVQYLILDDVKASACYQTTTRDLASVDDFNSLKKDAIEIQGAYRGNIAPAKPVDSDNEIDKIIKNATT